MGYSPFFFSWEDLAFNTRLVSPFCINNISCLKNTYFNGLYTILSKCLLRSRSITRTLLIHLELQPEL